MELMGMLQITFVESSWGNRLGNGKTEEREREKKNSQDLIHCGWITCERAASTPEGGSAQMGNLGRHLGTDLTQLPTGGSCDAEGNLWLNEEFKLLKDWK